jgi:CheY-like chemotaxis protein
VNQIKVLLVEDDREMMEDLPLLLGTYGLDVRVAPCESALLASREDPPQCILLDLKMPPPADMTDDETDSGRLTGVVLCRRIRAELPKVPILVFTSVSDEKAHREVRAAGANQILVKPQYPDEMVQQIRRLAEGR